MRKALDLDRSLRIAYAAGALVAGAAGALALASPRSARKAEARPPRSRLLDRIARPSHFESSLVGSQWLAIAGLSLLGLKRPRAMVAVPLMQMTYKSLWLARHGIPRLLRGDRSVAPLAGIFGAWILGLAAVRPWRVLAEQSPEPHRRVTDPGLGPKEPVLGRPDVPSQL